MVEKREEVSIRLVQIQRSVFYDDRFGGIRNISNPFAKSRRQTKPNPPSIKKPHQPRCRVVGLLFSFVDPSFKSFGQDRVYSNLYRNKD